MVLSKIVPKRRAQTILKTIPVEVLSADIVLKQPVALQRQQSELRKRTLEAVAKHGGRAVGDGLPPRERVRLFVFALKWQLFLLVTALVDVLMLVAEGASSSEETPVAVNVVTAIVLFIFLFDLGLRAYAFRCMMLKRPWAWFDSIVVGVSIVLFVVSLAFESSAASGGGAAASATRGGRALRGLMTALRAMRASRFAAKMLQLSSSATAGARHVTGENKQRFVDLVRIASHALHAYTHAHTHAHTRSYTRTHAHARRSHTRCVCPCSASPCPAHAVLCSSTLCSVAPPSLRITASTSTSRTCSPS
jgi:hypothetical protein